MGPHDDTIGMLWSTGLHRFHQPGLKENESLLESFLCKIVANNLPSLNCDSWSQINCTRLLPDSSVTQGLDEVAIGGIGV